ncbi:hypothetical protein ACHAXS_005567 [Conticribra weissflogii]
MMILTFTGQCHCCPTALANRRPITTLIFVLVTSAFGFTSVALPSYNAFLPLGCSPRQISASCHKMVRPVSLAPGERPDYQLCGRMVLNFSVDDLSSGCLKDRRACLSSIAYVTIIGANANADGGDGQHPVTEGGNRFPTIYPDALNTPISIALPLEDASGGTFCIRCTVFALKHDDTVRLSKSTHYDSDFRVYRAIVDTGSPYLVFPSSEVETDTSNKLLSLIGAISIFKDEMLSLWEISDYSPTVEIYGTVKGDISWKRSHYEFRDPRLAISKDAVNPIQSVENLQKYTGIVGVLDKALTNEATGGGTLEPFALLGLIRENNPNADRSRFPAPRPTFFHQVCITSENDGARKEFRVQSFSVNGLDRLLTLSTGSLISGMAPYMPLIDLRFYGDFVDHYAVIVDQVSFDEVVVTAKSLKTFTGTGEKPIVAVFDTGLTGGLLIREFWDVMQRKMAKVNKHSIADKKSDEIHHFQSVSLSIKQSTRSHGIPYMKGNSQVGAPPSSTSTCKISSSLRLKSNMFYIEPIDLDWFDDDVVSPYVIVLGQAFLSHGNLTIDMIQRRATFST